jgi:hypothetical protein
MLQDVPPQVFAFERTLEELYLDSNRVSCSILLQVFHTLVTFLNTLFSIKAMGRHLDGVVVSVLATGPKGRGFKPGQSNGFLSVIKIRTTPSSWMGSKAGRSHAVRLYAACKRTLEVPRGG